MFGIYCTSDDCGLLPAHRIKKYSKKCKLNRFEGVTLQLAPPSKFRIGFKMYANSFTFIDDVATGSRQNNRVEDREKALKHEARSVRSKTLSAGGVGFGVRWLIALAAGTSGDKHS